MVFGEDRSTIRAKFGAQNMSSLRNFAVGILHAMGVRIASWEKVT